MEITAQIHHYLTAAPTSHFRGQAVEMLDHWQGRHNLLWRVKSAGRDAVVKLYLDAGQARGRRQYDGQERFAPLGLAPRPLWFDRYPEGLARQVLVYEWLPGDPPSPDDATQITALAHSVGRVHNGDPTVVRRFCPHPIKLDYLWRVLQGGLTPIQQWLDARSASRLLAAFSRLASAAQDHVEVVLPLWHGATPTPVHGDLLLENALVSFGAVVLLDWEFFGLGDPALEGARFLHQHNATMDDAMQETWLEAYLTGFSQPGLTQRIAAYQPVLAFEALAFLLNGLREHFHQATDQAEFAAAAPFLADTLSTALDRSAHALAVPLPDDITFKVQTLLSQP